eukprot:2643983-Amphidinium_carterae.1
MIQGQLNNSQSLLASQYGILGPWNIQFRKRTSVPLLDALIFEDDSNTYGQKTFLISHHI